MTLTDVLLYLESWTDRPCVDKTGIQGLFNIQTTGWTELQPGELPTPGTKAEGGADVADLPTLFEVFDKLGLKLRAQKGNANVIVIDSVQKPSEN